MTWWQYLIVVIGLVISGFVASIQFVESDSFGESHYLKAFATFTKDHRIWMSFAFTIGAGLVAAGSVFFKPRKAQKEFRESLQDGIFEHLLDNNRNEGRITLFKDVGLWGTLWRRAKDFWSLTRRNGLRFAWSYCRQAHYIKILKRWGNHSQNSKTYFCVNRNNPDQCQGIAGLVRQNQAKVVRSLPNIDGWDLDAVGENDPAVQEFMSKGNIGDFRLLKSINKRAPYIYGNIISAQGGRKKYVLVIDSWANVSPFTKPAQKSLDRYVKHLSATFGAS